MNDIEFIPESDAIIMTTVNNSLITGLFRTWVSYNDGAQWTILDHSSDNMGWLKFLDPETGWSGRLQALSGPSSLFKYVGQPLIKNESLIWEEHDPGYAVPNLGCSSIDVVNKDVVWSAHAHYLVNDSLYGYFVDSLSRVARTMDGGQTWKISQVPLGNPAFIANITAIDANTAWLCGIDGGGGEVKYLKPKTPEAHGNIKPPPHGIHRSVGLTLFIFGLLQRVSLWEIRGKVNSRYIIRLMAVNFGLV
ncbi:MAG: hypothetical protein IPG79_12525 [Saprospiraceae bacterium]|nr:hypothetical protein [Saprospiraceae bacterium]